MKLGKIYRDPWGFVFICQYCGIEMHSPEGSTLEKQFQDHMEYEETIAIRRVLDYCIPFANRLLYPNLYQEWWSVNQ